jgi:hypothetical protein
MKYWIFQSNQVLGPFEADDLSRHSAFGAESLVCPEGRRGTSMGDWQRAGMVPDLSVALVRAAQGTMAKTSVATLAGLPPEPTLKDLAVLGSLQEKLAMLEDVVLQLQEGLRLKDSELATLHQELAGKERQTSVMKTAMEQEAEGLKRETDERKREAEERKRETETLKNDADEFKRKMAELEERFGAVNRLSETLEKAVEAEKNVEHDVEKQGASLAELTKEIETLRAQLAERMTAAPFPAPAPSSAASPFAPPPPAPGAPSASSWPTPTHLTPAPGFDQGDMPSIAPSPVVPPGALAEVPGEMPRIAPPPPPSAAPEPVPSPEPQGLAPLPSFGNPINPMGSMPIPGSPEAAFEPEPAAAPAPVSVDLSPAPPRSNKGLIFGALFGLIALAAVAVFTGRLNVPGLSSKKAAPVAEAAPPPMPVHAATAPAALPAPAPTPVVDPRDTAIETAREWELPDGRTLGAALETLAPPVGNLTPWMAEPSGTENRLSVNYFAQSNTPGAPTVAYQFEVDLAEKTLVGRNPAAKAVLAGKAVPPPAPPKAKPVKIKPKAKPKQAVKPKKKEENLDALLGGDGPPPLAPAAAPRKEAAPMAPTASDDSLAAPGEDAAPAPAKPTAAKRAAKAVKTAAPAPAKASDESLLDDILKE